MKLVQLSSPRTMILKLDYASESLGGFVKTEGTEFPMGDVTVSSFGTSYVWEGGNRRRLACT